MSFLRVNFGGKERLRSVGFWTDKFKPITSFQLMLQRRGESYVDDHLMREVVDQHQTAAGGAWAQTAFFPQDSGGVTVNKAVFDHWHL
ncbi:unnamed protein product [Musa acuminata subsp. malaccensis]|uniref:(wild Malaysian banana) hypothetical protein n=1 Tax=Musa acuminata subsp. malaccensis TaxID=214687 RepID=A0A804JDK0_MUSAM|nr:unnamed protein product [Musa acuminata subsp. malaccensis]